MPSSPGNEFDQRGSGFARLVDRFEQPVQPFQCTGLHVGAGVQFGDALEHGRKRTARFRRLDQIYVDGREVPPLAEEGAQPLHRGRHPCCARGHALRRRAPARVSYAASARARFFDRLCDLLQNCR